MWQLRSKDYSEINNNKLLIRSFPQIYLTKRQIYIERVGKEKKKSFIMRQRTTIYNPYSSHDGIITNLNRTNFQLSSIPNHLFTIENKYTITTTTTQPNKSSLYLAIKELRIQTKFNNNESGIPIFSFHYEPGLNIYAVPQSNVDKLEFWQQVEQLIMELLGIKLSSQQWIANVNSFYYHDIQPQPLLNLNLKEGWKFNLHPKSNYDYIYNQDKIIIRELLTNVSEIEFNLELGIYKEIGLFLIDDKISTNDDLNLSGIRVILDEDSNTNNKEESIHKTMFHIKPRHRSFDDSTTITTKIIPQGLHPILSTELNTTTIVMPTDFDVEECKFYYYLNLNKSLIFDQFQNIPIGSQLIINNGNKNLELPEYKINQWGNELLFEFEFDNDNDIPRHINLTVHSRYQLPQNNHSHSQISNVLNSLPNIFIGCNVKEGNLLDKSPFDTKRDVKIGGNYEIYFTEDTVFYHLQNSGNSDNSGSSTLLEINIPHGKTTFDRVNNITSLGLLIGALMILYAISIRVFMSTTSKTKRD